MGFVFIGKNVKYKKKDTRKRVFLFCVKTTALIQFNFSAAFEPTGFINGFI